MIAVHGLVNVAGGGDLGVLIAAPPAVHGSAARLLCRVGLQADALIFVLAAAAEFIQRSKGLIVFRRIVLQRGAAPAVQFHVFGHRFAVQDAVPISDDNLDVRIRDVIAERVIINLRDAFGDDDPGQRTAVKGLGSNGLKSLGKIEIALQIRGVKKRSNADALQGRGQRQGINAGQTKSTVADAGDALLQNKVNFILCHVGARLKPGGIDGVRISLAF